MSLSMRQLSAIALISTAMFTFINPAQAINLKQAYHASMDKDPSLKAQKAASAAAKDDAFKFIASWLPHVALNGYGFRGQYKVDGNNTSFRDDGMDVTGTQVLFNYSALQEALTVKYIKALSNIRYEIKKQNLIKGTIKAYMDVLAGHQFSQLARMNQKTVKTAVYEAKVAYRLHLKMKDVVDLAESDLDKAKADRIRANILYSDAIAILERMTQQTVHRIAPLKPYFSNKMPPPPNVSIWEQRALQHNLALKAIKLATAIAKRKVSIARGERLPTIKAQGSYSLMKHKGLYSVDGQVIGATNFNGSNRIHGYNIGLVASMPIFSGGAITAGVNAAEHLYQDLEYQSEALRRDILLKTKTDYMLLLSDFAKVNAELKAISANKDALRVARIQMNAHKKTMLDVLKLKTKLAATEAEYQKAVFAYIDRYIDLHVDAGELNQYVIFEINLFLNNRHPIRIRDLDKSPKVIRSTLKK